MIDLSEILPEELFDEVDKPKCKLLRVSNSNFVSNCPELLGNFMMDLYRDEQGNYYVERSEKEPIGDYGSSWVSYWYVCNDNSTVKKIIDDLAKEEE